MSIRFPLLIGISGKRKFDEKDATRDEMISRRVEAEIESVFSKFDDLFPHTPKILLTGVAFGADLIAAKLALCRGDHWAVGAILPFERSIFLEDFDPPAGQQQTADWETRFSEHKRTFEQLIVETNSRLIIRELPKLETGNGAATEAQLSRTRDPARYDKTLRRNHYEQVGQYIAEAATVMIAVMGSNETAEMNEANGGTARIVACRRAGRPDRAGTQVAQASSVLRNEWSDAVLPPAGFVWLIDPKIDAGEFARCATTVLPPILRQLPDEIYARCPGKYIEEGPYRHRGPLRRLWLALRPAIACIIPVLPTLEQRAEERRVSDSLILARGIERYHEAVPVQADPVAVITEIKEEDVASALEAARSTVSRRQREVNGYSRKAFWLLAGFFVLAILALEIFTKFLPHNAIAIALYVAALLAIATVAFAAYRKRLEPVSEDYRAVAEMLRVQRAWWQAELDERVDREHLQGVDRDLAKVRDAAKTIITWISLRRGLNHPRFAKGDWAAVRGTAKQARTDTAGARDWIGDQITYFTKNAQPRRERAHRAEAGSWTLFVASGFLSVMLCFWLIPNSSMQHWFENFADYPRAFSAPGCGCDFTPLVWLIPAGLALWFRIRNRDITGLVPIIAITSLLGMIIAFSTALALVSATPIIERLISPIGEHHAEETARHAIIVGLVVITAIAGAWRYLVERHNVEAEALEYRDALGRFARVDRVLARDFNPLAGPPDLTNAQKVVLDLGRLALSENEAWLKSRRERPLTPVVG
jgi:cell division protein FtsL